MASARHPSWQLLSGLRRPVGYLEQTRWLFGIGAILAMLLLTPDAAVNVSDLQQSLTLAVSLTVMVLCVRTIYVSGRAPFLIDAVCAIGLFGFALEFTAPDVAFSCAFPYIWFRAIYSSAARLVVAGALVAAAIPLADILWREFPGHPTTPSIAPVISTLPVMFLSLAFFRHLTSRLTSHNEARQRDAALAELGSRLLSAHSYEEIRDCGHAAITAICSSTQGLGILVCKRDDDALLVIKHFGELDMPPERLPMKVLPATVSPSHMVSAPAAAQLLGPAPTGCEWRCLALVDPGDTWILLLCPKDPGGEIATSIMSAVNQIALAIRNSDAQRELDTQAHTDALTGLANRSAFTQALAAAYADSGAAVLFLDLDDFKHVNDGLGHASGDELLRAIADRLASTVRAGDLCARLGGDEFAVILRGVTSIETATRIAQRIVDLVATPVALDTACAQVGASIGLAFGSPMLTAERLLQQADTAMYAAKSGGKNRFSVYDESMGGGMDTDRLGLLV